MPRPVDVVTEESCPISKPRTSTSSATSPTDNHIAATESRPIQIRTPSYGQSQPQSPTGTGNNTEVGSPPLATQPSLSKMRNQTSAHDLRHPPTTRAQTASELTTYQANALVAAASTVAVPQQSSIPEQQATTQYPKPTRPTPSPRSKSVSVSHFRNNNNSNYKPSSSTAQPDNTASTSTASTPRTPRQVLSADSAASGKSKDKKGGFLGILGKKSGGSGSGGMGMMGREKSPKRVFENGVLGKDGARVVVE